MTWVIKGDEAVDPVCWRLAGVAFGKHFGEKGEVMRQASVGIDLRRGAQNG